MAKGIYGLLTVAAGFGAALLLLEVVRRQAQATTTPTPSTTPFPTFTTTQSPTPTFTTTPTPTFTISPTNTTSPASFPTAQAAFSSGTYQAPKSVNTVVILFVNEAHEDYPGEDNKFIALEHPQVMPTNLVIYSGTAIAYHNSDGPWDSHHSEAATIKDSSGATVFSSGALGYPFFNKGPSLSPTVTLPPGQYTVTIANNGSNTPMKPSTITVLPEPRDAGAPYVTGMFYCTQVVPPNILDNDGGSHPGHLAYYQQVMPAAGWEILSTHNFTYAGNGGTYWPDNKTANHTVMVWRTTKTLIQVKSDLDIFTSENVYI